MADRIIPLPTRFLVDHEGIVYEQGADGRNFELTDGGLLPDEYMPDDPVPYVPPSTVADHIGRALWTTERSNRA